MISASHNPYEDNGIKFFSADGMKLPDAVESEIEAMLDGPLTVETSAQLGKARARATTPRAATSNSARATSRSTSRCAA